MPHGRDRRKIVETVVRQDSEAKRRRFILANTAVSRPPHVPEIGLRLADEVHELWHKSEAELDRIGLPPPFWAFAWAGGQGLARYILDHPQIVAGRKVLDLAAGCGLVGIAAAKAGASHVLCNDIDPFSATACLLNGELNHAAIDFDRRNLVQDGIVPESECQVVLAGDIFYDRALAAPFLRYLLGCRKDGASVLIGDPGRSYLPMENLIALAEYQVPVTRALEDSLVKKTTVWQFTAAAAAAID
jgi:predicted nicotinamide N-methyase